MTMCSLRNTRPDERFPLSSHPFANTRNGGAATCQHPTLSQTARNGGAATCQHPTLSQTARNGGAAPCQHPTLSQTARNGGAAGEGTLKLLQFEGNDVAIGLAAGLVVDFDEAVGPGAGELIGAKNDEGFVVIGAEGHLFLSGFDG